MKKRLFLTLALFMGLIPAIGLFIASAAGTKSESPFSFLPFTKTEAVIRNEKPRGAAKVTKLPRVALRRKPQHLAGQSATLLPDGRWLMLGGESKSGVVSKAEILDERTGATTALSSLRVARAWHSATMLPSGKILIFGGMDAHGKVVDKAELFNPDNQRFELMPLTNLTPRTYHTATLMTDGRVLMVGGVTDKASMVQKVEVWDPQTNIAVSLRVGLQTVRVKHSAIFLSNGSVLIWGGVDKDGLEIKDGELYDPEEQSLTWVGSFPETVESDAPYLDASVPANGATGIPVNSRVVLRFSKPMRVETLNLETFILAGPRGATAARIVPAENGMLAFVTPREQLEADSTYTLTLKDCSDNQTQYLSPAVLIFKTEKNCATDVPVKDAPANSPVLDEDSWIPDVKNLQGDWRSGRPDPTTLLPPLEASPGITALAGQVLALSGRPLANVTLEIAGQTAVTDTTGRFLLTSLMPGQPSMIIRGDTASRPGKTYGTFEVIVDVEKGKTNKLPYTIWLPVLDEQNAVRLEHPTRREVVVTTPRVPGLEVRLPQDVILRMPPGHGMNLMHGNASHDMESLGITPIPVDRSPFPLPPGTPGQGILLTLQMHGAKVQGPRGEKRPGIRLILPNYKGLPPDARASFWNYESNGGGWTLMGEGTVTTDGRQIVPDPGVEFNSMYCTVYVEGAGAAPGDGPRCGGCSSGGDPVDLATGLFVYKKIDLSLPDTIPILLTRTYRQNDSVARSFGKGSTHPYNMFLTGVAQQYVDLVLPDGGRVHFVRDSSQSGFVHTNTDSPTRFYQATLRYLSGSEIDYPGGGWEIRLLDGTRYQFYRHTLSGDILGIHASATGLHAIIDRFGNKLRIIREVVPNGTRPRITRIISPNGRWIDFSYAGTSETVTQVTDNLGRTVIYTYDTAGRLWKVTDVGGGVTEYSYDAFDRMKTIKDPRGNVFLTNDYRTDGKIEKQTLTDDTPNDPNDNPTYQFSYVLDANGAVTQADITDPRGYLRRTAYNAAGFKLTETEAVGTPEQQTTAYTLEAGSNLVTSVVDPLGRKTVYGYQQGKLVNMTTMADTAAASTTTFTYEPVFNQIATIVDALNHTTTFSYDNRGMLISRTDPLNHKTTFGYNVAGKLTSITDALQHTSQFIYDGADLVEMRDPLNHSTRQYFDEAGRVTKRINPQDHVTTYQYDPLNHLKKVTDPIQGETAFDYDRNGNLLSVTDARGKVTSYTYNTRNKLETRTDPLLRVERYEYDSANNIKKRTDRRGKVTTTRYDGLERLSFIGFGTIGEGSSATYESTINYTYDGGNRITQLLDSLGGTITRSYNDISRTSSESTAQGTIGYVYDAAGRRERMTVTGQADITYSHDNADRLTGITQGAAVVTYGYDNVNRRILMTLPNAISVGYKYDTASRLIEQVFSRSINLLGDVTYEYDAGGNRTSMGGSMARTELSPAINSNAYNNANQLTQRGTATFAYDENGNLLNDGARTYTWNARNQLTAISGAGITASFGYDAFGRRRTTTVNGQTTSYLYNGADAVKEVLNGTSVVDVLMGGLDEVYARSDGSGTRTLLLDGLGSTLSILDSAGVMQSSYSYEPFGNAAVNGAASNARQFTGRENDGTGLYYYRARYYSPLLQRFISQDPIGFASGDTNLYAYVKNNPVNKVDPTGLDDADYPIGGTSSSDTSGDSDSWRRNLGDGYGSLPYNHRYYPLDAPCNDKLPDDGPGPLGGIVGDLSDWPHSVYHEAYGAQSKNFPNGPLDPYGGAYRHCVAACLLNRRYGPFGGMGRLIWDWRNENAADENSRGDMAGEDAGLPASGSCEPCEKACLKPYPPQ